MGVVRFWSRPVNATANSKSLVDRDSRRVVEGNCYVLRGNGTYAPVELRNLSYDGCCVGSSEDFRTGEKLSLSVGSRGQIAVEVRWAKDGEVGLRFIPLVEERTPVERKQKRRAIRCEVGLRKVGRGGYRVDVRDLSPSGCKVTLVDRPRKEDRMLVKFDGLDALDCRVRWVDGYEAGLEFDRPIHVAVFDLLLTRLGG